MKFIQVIEERALQRVSKFAQRHEWRLRLVERGIERLVERRLLRAIDWVVPPWKRKKVLTRYVEEDTKPIKDVH